MKLALLLQAALAIGLIDVTVGRQQMLVVTVSIVVKVVNVVQNLLVYLARPREARGLQHRSLAIVRVGVHVHCVVDGELLGDRQVVKKVLFNFGALVVVVARAEADGVCRRRRVGSFTGARLAVTHQRTLPVAHPLSIELDGHRVEARGAY